jgi:protoheme IX farnesyltransferase
MPKTKPIPSPHVQLVREYYQLTKPGIIYGNTFVAAGGFLLASHLHIYFWLLAATLLGTALVIASSCVFNNYLDREIDKKMARTKKRALVSGAISGRAALMYAVILGILGFGILLTYTNILTFLVGLIGMFAYVAVYGVGKRKSIYGTIIGSISGALPPVAGYLAVRGHVDAGALIIFIILTCWQMPHFYGIAMYRLKDYQAAGIPVWPAVRGMDSTKKQMLLFIVLFIISSLALTLIGYTGIIYSIVMTSLGLWWLKVGIKGFSATDDTKWGRKMFLFSLIVIAVLPIAWALGSVIV